MITKKISLNELRTRIAKIVREEIHTALKEDISPHLQHVRDKSKLVGWIMRQYFNPGKHVDKVWYDASVDLGNVLQYVSDPKNNFPFTPKELADLWKLKKSLGASLELVAKDFGEFPEDEEDEDKTTYQTGEVTLKDIGKELGGLTPTMINKLATSGSEKIKKLTHGVAPWDMNEEQWGDLLKTIKEARRDVAKIYAENLKSYGGDVKAFLESLVKAHILTPSDLKLVSDQEFEGLALLSQKSTDQIINVILHDIERDNNVFKSYQSAVSKKVFPPGKRGRPKKKRE